MLMGSYSQCSCAIDGMTRDRAVLDNTITLRLNRALLIDESWFYEDRIERWMQYYQTFYVWLGYAGRGVMLPDYEREDFLE